MQTPHIPRRCMRDYVCVWRTELSEYKASTANLLLVHVRITTIGMWVQTSCTYCILCTHIALCALHIRVRQEHVDFLHSMHQQIVLLKRWTIAIDAMRFYWKNASAPSRFSGKNQCLNGSSIIGYVSGLLLCVRWPKTKGKHSPVRRQHIFAKILKIKSWRTLLPNNRKLFFTVPRFVRAPELLQYEFFLFFLLPLRFVHD